MSLQRNAGIQVDDNYAAWQSGQSLRGRRKEFQNCSCKKTACSSYVEPWLVAIGGWRLAVGGDWWLAVGS